VVWGIVEKYLPLLMKKVADMLDAAEPHTDQ
jgi:hypothetical protein